MATQTATKDWKAVKVGDIGQYLNGFAFKPSQWGNEGYPIIRIQNLNDPLKKFNYYDGKVPDKYLIKRGDILISWSASLGVYIWNQDFGWLNQHIFKATPNEEIVTKDFFYWSMFSAISGIAEYARGSTMKHVTKLIFDNYEIEIPASLVEQKAIAQTLTTVQDAITAQEALIAKLKELKRSMMQHLFTHGTKGEKTKMTEIGEIPESWTVTSVGDVCDVKGGKRLPKGEKLVSTNTGFPYIRVTDLSENSVDFGDIHYLTPEIQKTISRYVISTKDIYISIAGSTGFVGTIPQELDGANLTENAAKLCIKGSGIDQRFLMYWLASDYVQRDIKSQTVKNAQPKLALARIQQLPCVLPSIVEQKQIANTVDTIVDRIRVAEIMLATLQALFKTLLHELMSGKRRI